MQAASLSSNANTNSQIAFNFEQSYEAQKYGLQGALAYTLRHYHATKGKNYPAHVNPVGFGISGHDHKTFSRSARAEGPFIITSHQFKVVHAPDDGDIYGTDTLTFSGWGYNIGWEHDVEASVRNTPFSAVYKEMKATYAPVDDLQFLLDHLRQNDPLLAKKHRMAGVKAFFVQMAKATCEDDPSCTAVLKTDKDTADHRTWLRKTFDKQDRKSGYAGGSSDARKELNAYLENSLKDIDICVLDLYRSITEEMLQNSATMRGGASKEAKERHQQHLDRYKDSASVLDIREVMLDVVQYENRLAYLLNR